MYVGMYINDFHITYIKKFFEIWIGSFLPLMWTESSHDISSLEDEALFSL